MPRGGSGNGRSMRMLSGLSKSMRLIAGRVIDRLRERFPQYKWKYNNCSGYWECGSGYVCWVADIFTDECTPSGRLCFYRHDRTPEWV